MGQTIVGTLPKSQHWQEVAAPLQAPELKPAAVADERRLVALHLEPLLTYGSWLLTVPTAQVFGGWRSWQPDA